RAEDEFAAAGRCGVRIGDRGHLTTIVPSGTARCGIARPRTGVPAHSGHSCGTGRRTRYHDRRCGRPLDCTSRLANDEVRGEWRIFGDAVRLLDGDEHLLHHELSEGSEILPHRG